MRSFTRSHAIPVEVRELTRILALHNLSLHANLHKGCPWHRKAEQVHMLFIALCAARAVQRFGPLLESTAITAMSEVAQGLQSSASPFLELGFCASARYTPPA